MYSIGVGRVLASFTAYCVTWIHVKFTMDLYANQLDILRVLETLLDRSDVETLVSPFLHSTYCLVDVPPCYNSPYNILMDPEEKGEKYKIGYYVSDNKQIIDFTMGVRSDNPVGLRLVVTGLVENSKTNEKGVLQHFMMTTEVKVAEEGMMGCPEMTKEVTETMAPSMMDSMNGTYMGTMMDSMNATMM